MPKKTFFFSFLAVLFVLSSRVISAQTNEINILRQNYQRAMSVYLSEIAQFERNKLLYQGNSDQAHFDTALDSARQTYAARREVMSPYTLYLAGLLQYYVPDTALVQSLSAKMSTTAESFQALNTQFSDLPTWNQADTDFARAFATLNETAYQSFAHIYWHELHYLIENYTTLYQNQNLRILSEATSQIDRERKAQILAETLRSLESLQTKIAAEKLNLSSINSQNSYAEFLVRLNQIQAETQASLKQYAGLE